MPIFPGKPVQPKQPQPEETEEFNFLDFVVPELGAIRAMDQGADPRKDDSLNPLKIGFGLGETILNMGTGFFGSVPAAGAGVYEAIKEGDILKFPEAFNETREALTYEPRGSKGKKYTGVLGDIFALPDPAVDKYLVDPNIKEGRPGLATIGKTAAEALKMLAPLKAFGVGKGPKTVKPSELTNIKVLPKPAEGTLGSLLQREIPRPAKVFPGKEKGFPGKPVDASPDVTVYHGSGAKFEKFDPKFRKTGEGTAAYGEGLYLAESKSVAQTYAESIGGKGLKISNKTKTALDSVDRLGFSTYSEALSAIRKNPDWKQRWDIDAIRDKSVIKEINKQLAKEGPEPTLYKATIPGKMVDRMLDWDKPLSKQPKNVQKVFSDYPQNMTGGQAYQKMMVDLYKTDKSPIAEHLKDMLAGPVKGYTRAFVRTQKIGLESKGIPGIKYYDQFSRKADKKTRNYVLFDDAAAIIREINEKPVKTETEVIVAAADTNLAKSVGKLEIVRPGKEKLLNPADYIKSPRKVAEKFPEFREVKALADEAGQVSRELQNTFGKRVKFIDDALGGKFTAKIEDFGIRYRANKIELQRILLKEDMIGKDFTSAELQKQGVNPDIIRAHKEVRPAYDHILNLVNKRLVARGKEPINRRGGYVSHFFHTWMVREGGSGKILGSARNVKEATKIGQEAIRQGRDVRIEPKQFEFNNEGMQQITLADRDYFKFQKSLKDNFSMSVEEAAQLTQTLAKRKGRSRYFGPAIERKGAPNFEQNMDFAFKHYMNMAIRYVALDKFKQKATNDFIKKYGDFDAPQKMNTIAKYTKNYINDINGVPRQAEVVLDNLFKGDSKFARFMSDQLGERPSSQMAAFTTKAVAAAKLGFLNVSAAMVNGSQLMMANAILGARWMTEGITRAARLDVKKIGRGLGLRQKANPDLAILEKLGVEFQEGLEGAHNLGGKIGKMFDAGLLPFTMVEYRLRAAASLGAYYKAMAGKVKDVPGGNKPAAMEYARQVNTRANFDYTIADAPDFIRQGGPITQVAFQFKKFPVKALEFMSELNGAEAVRFWIPFATVSGMYGFPGFDALNRAVRSVYGFDIELETKDYWFRWAGDDPEKQAIATTIMKGIAANKELGGVDLSRRIGGGDFIPTRPSDLAGPALSSVWRAGQMAAQAEWVEAMRQMVTTPGNIALAIKNDGEIYSVWDRNRLRIKLTQEERIKKGFGLTGIRESTERDLVRIMKYNERKAREAKKEAIDNYIKVSGERPIDREALRDAAQMLADAEVTKKQVMTETEKKKMTPAMRAFDNLGERGQARNAELLKYAR